MPAPVTPLLPEDLGHVLVHTRELWTEAQGKSFFITGGTGFFGMWLLESFAHINDELGLGMRATVLTRDPAAFAVKAPHLTCRSDLAFIPGDIRSFVFPSGRFEYVIHAAAETSARVNGEAPHEVLDAIISGTRRLLGFAEQCSVKKILLTSSGAVYGPQPSTITHIPEDYLGAPDPLLPGSAYGEGKRVAEHMCCLHAQQHGYETRIARCFAFVGPHLPLNGHFAIGNFIRDAVEGVTIKVSGDGTPRRSYLYASDLAVWLWTLLFRGSPGRAYNVGSDDDLNIEQLAGRVARALGGEVDVLLGQTCDERRPVARYVPACGRARKELGLKALIGLESAIQKTARWHGWNPAVTTDFSGGFEQ